MNWLERIIENRSAYGMIGLPENCLVIIRDNSWL